MDLRCEHGEVFLRVNRIVSSFTVETGDGVDDEFAPRDTKFLFRDESIRRLETRVRETLLDRFALDASLWHCDVHYLDESVSYQSVARNRNYLRDNGGDVMLATNLPAYGRLFRDSYRNARTTSLFFDPCPWTLAQEPDYDYVERTALVYRPRLLVSGSSSYGSFHDFAKLRDISVKVGAELLIDASGDEAFLPSTDVFSHASIVLFESGDWTVVLSRRPPQTRPCSSAFVAEAFSASLKDFSSLSWWGDSETLAESAKLCEQTILEMAEMRTMPRKNATLDRFVVDLRGARLFSRETALVVSAFFGARVSIVRLPNDPLRGDRTCGLGVSPRRLIGKDVDAKRLATVLQKIVELTRALLNRLYLTEPRYLPMDENTDARRRYFDAFIENALLSPETSALDPLLFREIEILRADITITGLF